MRTSWVIWMIEWFVDNIFSLLILSHHLKIYLVISTLRKQSNWTDKFLLDSNNGIILFIVAALIFHCIPLHWKIWKIYHFSLQNKRVDSTIKKQQPLKDLWGDRQNDGRMAANGNGSYKIEGVRMPTSISG